MRRRYLHRRLTVAALVFTMTARSWADPPPAPSAPPSPAAPAEPSAPKLADENGTAVTFTSTHVDTEIFLARGPIPTHVIGDPYERIGVAPVTIKLAPGIYTIETVGPTQAVGHETFTVDRWPMNVEVRTGDASVKTIGTVLIAAGVISILAGIVVVASFGKGNSTNVDKYSIAIPLLAAGAGAAGIGVGMSFLGATNIHASMPPASPKSGPTGATVDAIVRF